MRWVHQYGPTLDERVRHHIKPTNDSWRVDETYVKVIGQWMYLYRAVDSKGDTIDFYLSKTRKKKKASKHSQRKLHVRSMFGFKLYETTASILSGTEAMCIMKKGQLHQVKSAQNEIRHCDSKCIRFASK